MHLAQSRGSEPSCLVLTALPPQAYIQGFAAARPECTTFEAPMVRYKLNSLGDDVKRQVGGGRGWPMRLPQLKDVPLHQQRLCASRIVYGMWFDEPRFRVWRSQAADLGLDSLRRPMVVDEVVSSPGLVPTDKQYVPKSFYLSGGVRHVGVHYMNPKQNYQTCDAGLRLVHARFEGT